MRAFKWAAGVTPPLSRLLDGTPLFADLGPLRRSFSDHEAIKIRGGKEQLAQRQKELMSKGLPKQKVVEGVKKVILISSAKGGVGKSTVAVNLAVGAKQRYPQLEVGLLDADVFGPSLPRMMNLEGEPELTKEGKMVPLQNYGVKCMSMGFLVDSQAPVVWRGLMVMSAIQKLVHGVDWSPSDILFVDMPPGTGDTQLTFAQGVKVDGAVIVTTPQKVALQDAVKGIEMFRKTGVPILGLVVNMSSYLCPKCQEETQLFPENVEKLGNSHKIPILGSLPLDFQVGQACDEGTPAVLERKYLERFTQIVERLNDKLENC